MSAKPFLVYDEGKALVDQHHRVTLNQAANQEYVMSDITREEIDAKLEAREARSEARLARFEERINLAISSMEKNSKSYQDSLGEIKADIASSQRSTANLIIASALTILFGVAGVNFGLFSAFDSGRETAKLSNEAQQASEKTTSTLKETQLLLQELKNQKQQQKN